MTEATKFKKFFEYLRETGETVELSPVFWVKQYDLLEAGVRDGRLHDASLVAYSRLEAENTEECPLCEGVTGNHCFKCGGTGYLK